MKINWKIRSRNKVWLLALLGAIVAFVYQILAMFGITPKVGQDQLMELVKILLTLLVGIGVIVDPTTPGTNDSDRAMSYGHEHQFAEEVEEYNEGARHNG